MGFSFGQFSEVLKIRDPAGRPYVLIGGQAVNYWAERFLTSEPLLGTFLPFTSLDIDFKGDQADVRHIARQLESVPGYTPKAALSALSGSIRFRIGDAMTTVEIVRRIPGIPNFLDTPAISAEWNGNAIRVLDPISLLACKLVLAATVSQKERQDVAHLRILLLCVRTFLAELIQEVELECLPAREWLKIANQVLKLTTNQRARKIAARHQIHWPDILPLAAIANSRSEKIKRFQAQQLERGFNKSKGGKLQPPA